MGKSVIVFLPNTLEKHKSGNLRGFYENSGECEAYYITSDIVSNNFTQCIGYIGKSFKVRNENGLFINSCSGKITVNNVCKSKSVMEVVYDYKSFKNSDFCGEPECYGKHFKALSDSLRKDRLLMSENGRSFCRYIIVCIVHILQLVVKCLGLLNPISKYSATFLHFEDSVISLKWFFTNILEERKITPKLGNALVAKSIDLLIGIILLNWFLKYECNVVSIIHTSIEDIITNLKNLLLYLMGSPIGLKLNYSFNKTLGKFFFYHISLWRVFLQGMAPLLKNYFRFLVLPGALGFSFQVAMFSDIVSIVTFHVYCIYVYAARLFSLQMKGLISLWRLFIGRKYNPLRQRVDSCQYSPNQLFIGTLGFTILLFLLPTTTLYYTVFTTFRLVILLIEGLLLRLRYFLSNLPLYVLTLWVFNSSSLAGTIFLNWKITEDADSIVIEAKLKTLSLSSSFKKVIPDTMQPLKCQILSNIFHSMLTGVLI